MAGYCACLPNGMPAFVSLPMCLKYEFSFLLRIVIVIIIILLPCYQPRSQGPLITVPWRERESLENAGHVSPRIWEMTKHNLEGWAGKSEVMVRISSPSLCYAFSSSRFWETHDQHFPGSLSLSRSMGREGEDPGNKVALLS